MSLTNRETNMKMRGGIGASITLALIVAAAGSRVRADEPQKATQPESTRPPQHLKKMADGHWTAWDPPAVPEGSKVHTVVPGDTLWALAGKNLNNPYLWPQIWDKNRYVLDSHWIYPGDPLEIPVVEVVPETPPAAALAAPPAPDEEEPAPAPVPAVKLSSPPPPPTKYPIGDKQDIYCAPHLHDGAPPVTPKIIASEESEMIGFGQGEVVYLNAGTDAGYKPGDRLEIVRDRGMIKHPATGEKIGFRVDGMGWMSLIAVQNSTSIAEIRFACGDINRGDRVVPFKEPSVPTRETMPGSKFDLYDVTPSGKASGYVVVLKDPPVAEAQGHIVTVDLGAAEGVKPGDMVRIFRPNPEGEDLPRLNLGEGIVLLTDPNSSLVRITASAREIYRGDRIELR